MLKRQNIEQMKISVGDKVRFLNDVGGGTVSRTEKNNVIYVLDEDGFEVPVMATEVVIVEKKSGDVAEKTPDEPGFESAEMDVEESDEEGEPRIVIACVRDADLSGNVNIYLVNDSNFYAFYTISTKQDERCQLAFSGQIEPNTKVNLDNVPVNLLDGVTYQIQLLLFRKKKDFTPQKPVDFKIKFSGSKLLKDSSYHTNAYFNEEAIVYYIVKSTLEQKIEQLTDKEIKQVVRDKDKKKKIAPVTRKDNKVLLEVDLHINELLDDTRGMSNKDMLDYQMEKFHKVMAENKENTNRKIVFIHGKGDGVLKSEILKALKRKYSWHTWQDASFKEYGYGATMVII